MDELFFTLLGKALFGIGIVVPLWYLATLGMMKFFGGIVDGVEKWLFTLPKEMREAHRMEEIHDVFNAYLCNKKNSLRNYDLLISQEFNRRSSA